MPLIGTVNIIKYDRFSLQLDKEKIESQNTVLQL